MTDYARFKAFPTDTEFRIVERDSTPRNPKSYSSDWFGHYTEEGGLNVGRSQDKPVSIHYLDGTTKELGNTFCPDTFERACYGGYVSYGQSMTDGHYAPESFFAWVWGFRKDPKADLRYNDAADYVKASVNTYIAARAA